LWQSNEPTSEGSQVRGANQAPPTRSAPNRIVFVAFIIFVDEHKQFFDLVGQARNEYGSGQFTNAWDFAGKYVSMSAWPS
jgi:hypothetical protein